MNRCLLLFILILGLVPISVAQSGGWETGSPLPGSNSGIIVNPINNHLFVSTYEAGIFRSSTEGTDWQLVYAPPNQIFYSIAVRPDGTIFAGGLGSIFWSADNGANWNQRVIGNGLAITSIGFNQAGHILAGTQTATDELLFPSNRTGGGVYFSADNGNTWAAFNQGLENTNKCVGVMQVSSQGQILIGLHDQGATDNGGIFVLNPATQTWQLLPIMIDGRNQINGNITVRFVQALLSEGDKILASVEGVSGRVYCRLMVVSADGGNTWRTEPVNLPEPADFNDQPAFRSIFRARDFMIGHLTGLSAGGGVYHSTAAGLWEKFPDNQLQSVFPIRFAEAAPGKLYAVETNGVRFFRTTRVTNNPEEITADFSVNLYPNPSPGILHANLNLNRRAPVTITLTDVAGRSWPLLRQNLAAGKHAYQWNLAGHPAGIYMLRFQTGDKQIVKKAALMP